MEGTHDQLTSNVLQDYQEAINELRAEVANLKQEIAQLKGDNAQLASNVTSQMQEMSKVR